MSDSESGNTENGKGKINSLGITPTQLLNHAQVVRIKYNKNPERGAAYLEEILQNNGFSEDNNEQIEEIRDIIYDMKKQGEEDNGSNGGFNLTPKANIEGIPDNNAEEGTNKALKQASEEILLRKTIEEYYLPKQLIDAILELGEIPRKSVETHIGIGFIDIADYTFLSKFLSPMENQSVLNGLYTAFNWVLRRHGGYLNKIEGDSLMFHFGGLIDPKVKQLGSEEEIKYIAKELFYTCVEMQRVCVLFNQANDKFIYEEADGETKEALHRAFDIISTLRNNLEVSESINALFQIRIRIGANVGEVTIGNFGPEGAKQWDVIGLPVIDAKRMEATAPIGGLRISENFYKVLEETGVVNAYFYRFQKEAQAHFGFYRDITRDELFRKSRVQLKDKKNAEFITYSVQVNPKLPEDIMNQVELLMDRGEPGSNMILEFLQYYRGNRFVINAIEQIFKKKGINVRKDQIVTIMFPNKYKAYLDKMEGDKEKTREYINKHYTLFLLFDKLGKYQDKIKEGLTFQKMDTDFTTYEQFIEQEKRRLMWEYKQRKTKSFQRMYFYNLVFPLVFKFIRTSILEYQNIIREEEVLEEL